MSSIGKNKGAGLEDMPWLIPEKKNTSNLQPKKKLTLQTKKKPTHIETNNNPIPRDRLGNTPRWGEIGFTYAGWTRRSRTGQRGRNKFY